MDKNFCKSEKHKSHKKSSNISDSAVSKGMAPIWALRCHRHRGSCRSGSELQLHDPSGFELNNSVPQH